jgi:hypothetical protein
MALTVGDLKRMIEDLDDDMEVRTASQPSWPFEYSIASVEVIDLNAPELQDDDGESVYDPYIEREPGSPEPNEVCYIVEGTQLGYLPGIVTNAIGWGGR